MTKSDLIRMSASLPDFRGGYTTASAMQSTPPFFFEGVTCRTFPLRAKLAHVKRFVDQYINFIPGEIGVFRPYVPFVYLMVLNYGKMSIEAANQGWISQKEICFSIPLEWYKHQGGRLVFHDWALLTPFIYVDAELSMFTGREVYGWPKQLVWLEKDVDEWNVDPRAGETLVSVNAMVFPDLYRGQRQEPRTFLRVIREREPSPSVVPPEMRSRLWPWVGIPSAIVNSSAMLGDYVGIMRGLGLVERQPGATPDNWWRMARTAARTVDPRNPRLALNTVNVKQFRSCQYPQVASYQAITNAKMRYTSINRFGLIGDQAVLLGDTSGGIAIELYNYGATPIVSSLGLAAHSTRRDGDVEVSTLRPVFPSWVDVDMKYGFAQTLAWRAQREPAWHEGPGIGGRRLPATAKDLAQFTPHGPRYNTARAGASQEIQGPFLFPNTTIRVMPLLADAQRLRGLVAKYLNASLSETGDEFEAWGSYVYCLATNYEGMSSLTNNVGWWADREVGFYVPVKWYRRTGEGDRKLLTLALLPVFNYANTTTASITGSEVTGVATLRADISSPPSNWMTCDGPKEGSDQDFLRVTTDLLPVAGEGQRVETRTLLEVKQGLVAPYDQTTTWRHLGAEWGRRIRDEVDRKRRALDATPRPVFENAQALAVELLGNGAPLNIVTLKQFRDATVPTKACYQAINRLLRRIERIDDIREIEQRLYMRIFNYPTQPIVDVLGLQYKAVGDVQGGVVYDVEPVRPFWMRVSLRDDLGQRQFYRAGESLWRDSRELDGGPYYFDPPGDGPAVGPSLVRMLADVPQRLSEKLDTWRRWRGQIVRRAPRTSLAEAEAAVDAVEPQLIVEAVLSHEWEHWGNPRWYQEAGAIQREIVEAQRGDLDATQARHDAIKVVRKRQDAYLASLADPSGPSPGTHVEWLVDPLAEAMQAVGLADYVLHFMEGLTDAQATGEPGQDAPLACPELGNLDDARSREIVAGRIADICIEVGYQPLLDAIQRDLDAAAPAAADTRRLQAAFDDLRRLPWYLRKDGGDAMEAIRAALAMNESFASRGARMSAAQGYARTIRAHARDEAGRIRPEIEAARQLALDQFREAQRRAICVLAKVAQKPLVCCATDTIQHDGEAERWFPMRLRWRRTEYVGESLQGAEEPPASPPGSDPKTPPAAR